MTKRQERNRQTALDFYDLMLNQCGPSDGIWRYADVTYIQHNPEVADSKQAFIDYFVRMAKDYPGKRVEFSRAFADGEHVILHCDPALPPDLVGEPGVCGDGHRQPRRHGPDRRAWGRAPQSSGHCRERQHHVLI